MQVIKSLTACVVFAALGGCLAEDGSSTSRSAVSTQAPSGYQRLLSPMAHNFQKARLSDGAPTRSGPTSERFELRDADCGGSDCANPRARAEIERRGGANRARVGQDIWYGWSFYNANVPSFSRKESLRLVFGQWTTGGESKPIFRFIQLGRGEGNFAACDRAVCSTRSNAGGDLAVQLQDIASANGWGRKQNDGYVCRLFDLQANKGKWVDIVVNTNFSANADGYLRIWANDKQVCNYSGPLVSPATAASRKAPRHRRGIYSSWTKRWTSTHGSKPRPTLLVYYDEFRSGRAREDVDIRAIEAAAVASDS